MALNVAFPLSGLLPESLYEHYALISPIPQDFEEDYELLVTPYGSSESGLGSSDDSKIAKSSSEDEETPSNASSASSTSSTSPTPGATSKPASPIPTKSGSREIQYHGRDVLDLAKNLTDSTWKFQYARLPNNNVAMFMANRSQYHRLGANGLFREYDLATCTKCTFQFPVNSPNIICNREDGATNAKPIQSTNDKAQNNLPSYKMYKHF